MSRSGYTEGCDSPEEQWALIRWRGAVSSAIRGKRGQSFFKRVLIALDSMQKKELIDESLVEDGAYCTLGALANHEAIKVNVLGPEYYERVAKRFGIAEAMTREIVWANDECGNYHETPVKRFNRMRQWVVSNINNNEVSK